MKENTSNLPLILAKRVLRLERENYKKIKDLIREWGGTSLKGMSKEIRMERIRVVKYLESRSYEIKEEIQKYERKIHIIETYGSYDKSEQFSTEAWDDLRENTKAIVACFDKNNEWLQLLDTAKNTGDMMEVCVAALKLNNHNIKELWGRIKTETKQEFLNNFYVFEDYGAFAKDKIFIL